MYLININYLNIATNMSFTALDKKHLLRLSQSSPANTEDDLHPIRASIIRIITCAVKCKHCNCTEL